MKPAWLVFLLFLIVPIAVTAEEDIIYTVNDFGYARSIEMEPGHAVYQLPLPKSIYDKSANGKLGDLRVFNGAGEAVVHAISRIPAEKKETRWQRQAPIFPIYVKEKSQLEDMSLRIVRDQKKSVVDIKTYQPNSKDNTKLVAYIISLEDNEKKIDKLILSWSDQKKMFTTKVNVEASTDLEAWRPLSFATVVARLKHGGHVLEQREIKFRPTKAKYLRLTWQDSDSALPIAFITVQATSEEQQKHRHWQAYVTSKDNGPQYFLFENVTGTAVDRVQLILPDMNTAVWAQFYSRSDPKFAWRSRGRGLFYDLMVDGEHLSSLELNIRSSRDRYWRVHIPEVATALGKRQPQVKLGWWPDRLLFIARGNGPFTLAYGNHKVQASELPASQLLNNIPKGDKPFTPQSATLGQERIVLGDKALGKDRYQAPWQRWGLWALLILGVGLLAWMAIHLAKQLKEDS